MKTDAKKKKKKMFSIHITTTNNYRHTCNAKKK